MMVTRFKVSIMKLYDIGCFKQFNLEIDPGCRISVIGKYMKPFSGKDAARSHTFSFVGHDAGSIVIKIIPPGGNSCIRN